MRALKVHCAMRDVRQDGIIALAVQRFLEAHGDPVAQKLLKDG